MGVSTLSADSGEAVRIEIMNIAVGIGAWLLGGWALNAPVEKNPSDVITQTPAAQSALPSNTNPWQDTKDIDKDATKSQRGNAARPNYQTPGRARPMGWLPASPTEPGRSRIMPTPPTENSLDMEYGDPSFSPSPSGSPMDTGIPEVPTSRRAYAPRTVESPSYHWDIQRQRQSNLESVYPPHRDSLSTLPEKAFATARPFASGVSPYMGLFRNDTAGGTIDNYSTFVRPALEQRTMNQQFNMDIFGLDRNSRLQNAAMQQTYRQNATRAPQSIGTPQFYMNYGNYYPGLGPGQNGYYPGLGAGYPGYGR